MAIDTSSVPVFRRTDVRPADVHWLLSGSTAIRLETGVTETLERGIYAHPSNPKTDEELRALMADLETRREAGENV